MSNSAVKIFSLIPLIMRDVGAIEKKGFNQHGNYKFRSIDDVYNALHPVLAKHGVFFVPSVLTSIEERLTSAKGTAQLRVKLKVLYTVFADDGSKFETIVEGEGIDTGDKATNKALTAAFKYMLIQVFCIPIEGMEDADSESHELDQQTKPPLANRSSPKSAINEVKRNRDAAAAVVGDFVCSFGKFKTKKLKDLDPYELLGYCTYIRNSAEEQNKPISGAVAEFLLNADKFINAKIESPAALQVKA